MQLIGWFSGLDRAAFMSAFVSMSGRNAEQPRAVGGDGNGTVLVKQRALIADATHAQA